MPSRKITQYINFLSAQVDPSVDVIPIVDVDAPNPSIANRKITINELFKSYGGPYGLELIKTATVEDARASILGQIIKMNSAPVDSTSGTKQVTGISDTVPFTVTNSGTMIVTIKDPRGPDVILSIPVVSGETRLIVTSRIKDAIDANGSANAYGTASIVSGRTILFERSIAAANNALFQIIVANNGVVGPNYVSFESTAGEAPILGTPASREGQLCFSIIDGNKYIFMAFSTSPTSWIPISTNAILNESSVTYRQLRVTGTPGDESLFTDNLNA